MDNLSGIGTLISLCAACTAEIRDVPPALAEQETSASQAAMQEGPPDAKRVERSSQEMQTLGEKKMLSEAAGGGGGWQRLPVRGAIWQADSRRKGKNSSLGSTDP